MEPTEINAARPDDLETGPDAAATAEYAAATTPVPAPEPDIWDRVGELDPDELFRRHPALERRFHGAVGSIAQRQAQQIAAQQAAHLQAEAERRAEELAAQRELERLRETDIFAWDQQEKAHRAQTTARQEMERKAQEAQQLAAMAAWADYDTRVLHPMANGLSPADLQELAQRNMQRQQQGMDGYTLRSAWTQDVLAMHKRGGTQAPGQPQTSTQGDTGAAQAQLLAAQREAMRKEILGEANAAVTVDTGAGAPLPGVPSQDEWASYSRDQRVQMRKADPAIEDKIMQRALREGAGTPFTNIRQAGAIG